MCEQRKKKSWSCTGQVVANCVHVGMLCNSLVHLHVGASGFVATPSDSIVNIMQHLFEGGYYFPSLTVKSSVNPRVTTKRGECPSNKLNMVCAPGVYDRSITS